MLPVGGDSFLNSQLQYKVEYVKSDHWGTKEHKKKEVEKLIPTKEDWERHHRKVPRIWEGIMNVFFETSFYPPNNGLEILSFY